MMDLKSIEDRLTSERVIELVTMLGSDKYIETPTYIQFKTICHNIDPEEASLKLYYYKKNKKFHCYTDCGDNFNIFELFKRRYELVGKDYNFYKDIVLVISGNKDFHIYNEFQTNWVYQSRFDKYQNKFGKIEIKTINSNLLNIFTFYPTQEWIEDGISIESMKEFNILYSISQNKIIIPHYNINDELIGIRGRSLNEEDIEKGKYMPVTIENVNYSHPLGYNLYGLNKTKDNIKKTGLAILVEGEKSVLQFDTMFGKDRNCCAAVCGSSIHAYQMELLKKIGAKKVLIAFDKEGGDYVGKEKYFNKLKMFCERYKNFFQMGFIYDTKNLLDLKDSPTDKGKDVFLNLYKEAIWVK